jgi:hypothetical protein
MSSIVLSGDTSGTVTVAAPAVAGTNTATLPAATGTVMVSGNMPAFSAYANTTVSAAPTTFTKLLFQVEEFDTNNNFASSRFTPTVAGYYQINGMVTTPSTPASGALLMSLFKNGSRYLDGNGISFSSNNPKSLISTLIYFNGSTDYVELYGYQSSVGTINLLGNGLTEGYFQAAMVRSA